MHEAPNFFNIWWRNWRKKSWNGKVGKQNYDQDWVCVSFIVFFPFYQKFIPFPKIYTPVMNNFCVHLNVLIASEGRFYSLNAEISCVRHTFLILGCFYKYININVIVATVPFKKHNTNITIREGFFKLLPLLITPLEGWKEPHKT